MILQGLRDFNCPRNLYISKAFFSSRKAVINTQKFTIERNITKGSPQGSCSGPGFWNILYNSLLTLELNNRSRIVAFADDLVILTRGETVTETENFMNAALPNVQNWAHINRLEFKEDKSKVMLLTKRKRKERKEIAIYVNNKKLTQVNHIRYLGIIFDNKLTFREHIIYIEEKCTKIIFSLARSAKITWGLKHKALRTIYAGAILPLILYVAPVWKEAIKRACYKAKIG